MGTKEARGLALMAPCQHKWLITLWEKVGSRQLFHNPDMELAPALQTIAVLARKTQLQRHIHTFWIMVRNRIKPSFGASAEGQSQQPVRSGIIIRTRRLSSYSLGFTVWTHGSNGLRTGLPVVTRN